MVNVRNKTAIDLTLKTGQQLAPFGTVEVSDEDWAQIKDSTLLEDADSPASIPENSNDNSSELASAEAELAKAQADLEAAKANGGNQ